jgi:hypothetical protein
VAGRRKQRTALNQAGRNTHRGLGVVCVVCEAAAYAQGGGKRWGREGGKRARRRAGSGQTSLNGAVRHQYGNEGGVYREASCSQRAAAAGSVGGRGGKRGPPVAGNRPTAPKRAGHDAQRYGE